jgi:hypothetical protein
MDTAAAVISSAAAAGGDATAADASVAALGVSRAQSPGRSPTLQSVRLQSPSER